MDLEPNKSEHGQNLIIFAVIIVVLIGLAGLAIDGGFSLAARRQAQNAADAGALAGGAILCKGGTEAGAESIALDYAINKNNADTAFAIISGDAITVTTSIPHQTFLMKIFSTDVVTTTANASAGCYSPCTVSGMLPVAWSCRAPAGEPEDSDTCGIQYGTLTEEGPIYVFMDTVKTGVDNPCYPDGTLNCDLNGDGINELFGGGGTRGWLNYNGGAPSDVDLQYCVKSNGCDNQIHVHTWYHGSGGAKANIFSLVDTWLKGQIVWLPVFDAYCTSTGDPDVVCPDEYHFGTDQIVAGTGAGYDYHIISFSAIKITCVSTKASEHCPGKDAAIALNPGEIPDNTKSIEGYFVKLDGGTGKCDGPDTGIHTIYLDH
jgi:Flp pilus assembly protein TadG